MNSITDWIQAISAILIVILTCLTLCKVWQYTAETQKIREAMITQMMASQRPFFIWDYEKSPSPLNTLTPIIRNIGNGPAVEVYWKLGRKNETDDGQFQPHPMWERLGAIGVGSFSIFRGASMPTGALESPPAEGLRIHFCDMAENWYWFTYQPSGMQSFTDSGVLKRSELYHLENFTPNK